jgi:hypothetical protein
MKSTASVRHARVGRAVFEGRDKESGDYMVKREPWRSSRSSGAGWLFVVRAEFEGKAPLSSAEGRKAARAK